MEDHTLNELKESGLTVDGKDATAIIQALCETVTSLLNNVSALQKEKEVMVTNYQALKVKLDKLPLTVVEIKADIDRSIELLKESVQELKDVQLNKPPRDNFSLDSFRVHVIEKLGTMETIDDIMTMNKMHDSFKVREIVKKLTPTVTSLQELLENQAIGCLTSIILDKAATAMNRADREHLVKYFAACETFNATNNKFLRHHPDCVLQASLRQEYEEVMVTLLQVISPASVHNLDQLLACFDPALSAKTVLSNLASLLHFLVFHGISEIVWDPTIPFPSISSVECFLQSRVKDRSFIRDCLSSTTHSQDLTEMAEGPDGTTTSVSEKTNGGKRKRAMISTSTAVRPQPPSLAPPPLVPPPPRPPSSNYNNNNYQRDNNRYDQRNYNRR